MTTRTELLGLPSIKRFSPDTAVTSSIAMAMVFLLTSPIYKVPRAALLP